MLAFPLLFLYSTYILVFPAVFVEVADYIALASSAIEACKAFDSGFLLVTCQLPNWKAYGNATALACRAHN